MSFQKGTHFCRSRVLLCSLSSLELMAILLLQPFEHWGYRCVDTQVVYSSVPRASTQLPLSQLHSHLLGFSDPMKIHRNSKIVVFSCWRNVSSLPVFVAGAIQKRRSRRKRNTSIQMTVGGGSQWANSSLPQHSWEHSPEKSQQKCPAHRARNPKAITIPFSAQKAIFPETAKGLCLNVPSSIK